ncbi:DcuS/MalK family sensor histidine kinase [Oleispirillum naphthae]|uniref:DcuS/MalK family sensor histidine kinase n=1 Tax=Oleispirillum naphthae TaxID=2838853 RepID=UPI0030823861
MRFNWLSSLFRKTRLRTKLILLVCVMFVPSVILLHIHVRYLIDSEYRQVAGAQAMNVAEITVHMPLVKRFMQGERDLFPAVASELSLLSKASQVRFIVLIDMHGIRAYHPTPRNIGKHVVGGDAGDVLEGKSYISFATGTFGRSLRALAPIHADDGRQVGAVVVGIMSDSIERTISRFVAPIWPALFFLMLGGVILAVLFSRGIINVLHGLEPEEIARSLEERVAMLSTVREGIVAVDKDARVTIVNEAAARILNNVGVCGEFLGKPVEEVVPNLRLREVLQTGRAEFDNEQNLHGTAILTNRRPIMVKGILVGAIATFRDMTEVRQLAENLTGVNRYVDALRTQSHEFLNQLHVIYGLLQKRQHAALSDYLSTLIGVRLKDHASITSGIKDPVIAGFLSSKFAKARELGIHVDLEIEGILHEIGDPKLRNGFVTIVGNLFDNGLDAMADTAEKTMAVAFTLDDDTMWIMIKDTGEGIDDDLMDKIFARYFSTKGHGRGLGLYLVLLTVDSLGGTLEIDSARGKGTTVTVQLPLQADHGANA